MSTVATLRPLGQDAVDGVVPAGRGDGHLDPEILAELVVDGPLGLKRRRAEGHDEFTVRLAGLDQLGPAWVGHQVAEHSVAAGSVARRSRRTRGGCGDDERADDAHQDPTGAHQSSKVAVLKLNGECRSVRPPQGGPGHGRVKSRRPLRPDCILCVYSSDARHVKPLTGIYPEYLVISALRENGRSWRNDVSCMSAQQYCILTEHKVGQRCRRRPRKNGISGVGPQARPRRCAKPRPPLEWTVGELSLALRRPGRSAGAVGDADDVVEIRTSMMVGAGSATYSSTAVAQLVERR